MTDVKLLSEATNFAVVHLSGRAFPGVVFQGDSLDSFIADLEEAFGADDPDEKSNSLREIIERLRGVQAHYEAVLSRAGINLPYTRT